MWLAPSMYSTSSERNHYMTHHDLPDDFTFKWFEGDPPAKETKTAGIVAGAIAIDVEVLDLLIKEVEEAEKILYTCIKTLLDIVDHTVPADYRTAEIEAVRSVLKRRKKT